MKNAMGLPSARPWRMPPIGRTSSWSSSTPAGTPLTTTVRPGPCDSPAVTYVSSIGWPSLSGARRHRGQEPLDRPRLQFGAPRADEHDAVFGVLRAAVIVAAIAVAAGCGQASGGDSVVHPATF